DFVALNVYTGVYRRSDGKGGFEDVEFTKEYPVYNIFWLRHLPDALYWGLRFGQDLGIKTFYISENGCCATDQLTDKGEVLDVDRVQYLRSYLRAAHRAVSDGIALKGYFCWSLMDNFEWSEGYTKRFGLYYVDYATQKRIPKLSAKWYAQVTRANRVL
ncbi:MAG TPA: family 1 glycosylhydrolase, partial [Planctomycetota bacterium]|nr:family 1 glycosylhydrolase [Planctomycetota bacterium]